LAYEECGPSNRENQARLLNLDTQDEQTISSFKDNFENRGWESGPILSRDGKHLVVQIPHGIFEIMADGEYKRIDQGDLDIYWDMAWSPVDNVLVYGATDKQLEVGYALTHLFLLDVEQNETMQLFKTGDRSKIIPFLNREVWSPSGKRIVALVEHYPTSTTSTMDLCVITTDPVKADCQQIAGEGKIISDPAWSPDSKYLIYEEYEMIKGSKAIISIMVYSIDTKKIFKLLSFTPEVTYYHDIDNQKMFWRYP
jgi:WD40 repeat protein